MRNDYSPAVAMYQTQLMSCQMIADQFKVTRQTIHSYLRKHGIDTSKAHTRMTLSCRQCHVTFTKPRCQIRNTANQFCSTNCYFKFIANPAYNEHRQGQRMGRAVLEEIFGVGIMLDKVVHHADGNDDNNDPRNLWAFHTQSDHMRYHRGGLAIALKGESRKWEPVQKLS